MRLRVDDGHFEEDLCGLLAVVLVFDFFIIGIDDVAIAVAGGIGLRVGIGRFGLLRFIHRLAKLHRGFEKRLGLGLDVFSIRFGGFDSGLQRSDCVGNRGALGFRDLVTEFLQRLFRRMDQAFGSLTIFSTIRVGLSPPEAWIRICCSLPVPLSLAETLNDAVGVDIEGDFDLRDVPAVLAGCRLGRTGPAACCPSHFAFALEDPDGHRRLVVFGRREGLRLLGRDRRVALDQDG